MKKSDFQFKNPTLTKLLYKFNTSFKKETFLGLEMNAKVKIKKADNNAIVCLELNVFNEEEFNDVPFFIDISMEGEFKWNEAVSENVDQLLSSNAPAILLSYMRPYISNITVGSGLPPLILPLMNFTDKEFDIEEVSK